MRTSPCRKEVVENHTRMANVVTSGDCDGICAPTDHTATVESALRIHEGEARDNPRRYTAL